MTSRCWWLILFSICGAGCGIYLQKHAMAWTGLALLFWLALEWIWFEWRCHGEIRRLRIRRLINGRSESSGYLWAGRTANIEVQISTSWGTLSPVLTFADCLPENLQPLRRGHEQDLLQRCASASYEYEIKVGSAGIARIPGFKITLRDAFGLFANERFVASESELRILPAFRVVGDYNTMVKRVNSLPSHGVHRLQRSGMGSELLELREYVPGDPPKSIAWKVSARRENLMTRQYESEVPVRMQLLLDGTIGTRLGGFGQRLLDQSIHVAASAARTAIAAGDPVGAFLFDEERQIRVPAMTGEKGFYRLMEKVAEFSENRTPPKVKYSRHLFLATQHLCQQRFPELLEDSVNRVPFSIFPLRPWKRRQLFDRWKVANVLSETYRLPADKLIQLTYDDRQFAEQAQKLMVDCGIAWMEPLLNQRDSTLTSLTSASLLAKALQTAVSRARDNEVFVVLANLLDSASTVPQLLPAVRMARARHHRVVVIVPTPSFRRPSTQPLTTPEVSVQAMLDRAADLKAIEMQQRLKEELSRLGVRVVLSGEPNAIQSIMSEATLCRSGRTARAN